MNILRWLALLFAFWLYGCTFTNDVNRRQAGQHWYYYGDLLNFYHDETGGRPVSVVWWEQVQYQEVKRADYAKAIQNFAHLGYRKIGYVTVRSKRPLYAEDVKGLAADKGAQIVVSYSYPVGSLRGTRPELTGMTTEKKRLGQQRYYFDILPGTWTESEYWFQFLGK